jgi:hypothetical protein
MEKLGINPSHLLIKIDNIYDCFYDLLYICILYLIYKNSKILNIGLDQVESHEGNQYFLFLLLFDGEFQLVKT